MRGPYRTALVTGASRGIGAAIVETLVERGIEVLAVARSLDRLRALADRTGCRPLALDLEDRASVAAALGDLEIDVLVNNAGVITATGPFVTMSGPEIERMLDLNLRATMQVTRLLLPGMIARRRGHLFFMSSTAARHAYPDMAVYAATKAGLAAFAACLRLELAGTGVRVTEIAPGRVETDIYLDAMGNDGSVMRRRLYDDRRSLQPAQIGRLVALALDLPPEADVTVLEVTPTDQAFGGYVFAERPGSRSPEG
jgi:NADP-dependent 3-hydroxy acid dehydrogenase YdfG